MGRVSVVTREYKGWKNCVEVSNGIIDLVATTDVGPRIIRFGFIGQQNEFCELEKQIGKTGAFKYQLYGGHRIWHGPEAVPRTYQPDNSKIDYQMKENGVLLSQPVESWTQIKKEIEIEMSPGSSKVRVIHRLINKGAWPVELSVWAVSVMAPGGKEIIPQPNRDTGCLPNRIISLWPYTKMNDHRVYWGEKYITIKQDTNTKPAFKIGIPNESGWAAYANHNHLFVLRHNHILDATYPDYSVSYETYTNDELMEMETLGPLVKLEPDNVAEHVEIWSLLDNVKEPANEEEIEKYIVPLIG